MALVVQKFGGSSVKDAERVKRAARRAIRTWQAGNQVIVVVSARGDTTDELIELAHEIHRPTFGPRDEDMLLSTGEQVSIALDGDGHRGPGPARPSVLPALQIGIVTDSFHTKALD